MVPVEETIQFSWLELASDLKAYHNIHIRTDSGMLLQQLFESIGVLFQFLRWKNIG